MKKSSVRRVCVVCLALFALAVLAVPIAHYASGPSSVLEACINPGNGGMRLVDAATACHANETRVQWNVTGPAGPAGPAGPPGPEGPAGSSSGGPPYVWVCTPAHQANSSSISQADLYVFNGSADTANVSVNILNKTGDNLAGEAVPGAAPGTTYPGQTGTSTVPVAPANTYNVTWATPAFNFTPTPDLTKVSWSVRVTSDKPVVVSSNFEFTGSHPIPCSLLPK